MRVLLLSLVHDYKLAVLYTSSKGFVSDIYDIWKLLKLFFLWRVGNDDTGYKGYILFVEASLDYFSNFSDELSEGVYF